MRARSSARTEHLASNQMAEGSNPSGLVEIITMGLKEAIEELGEDNKDGPEYCPECEKEGEKSQYYYWRCTTPSSECRVMTYIPTDYEIDRDKFLD